MRKRQPRKTEAIGTVMEVNVFYIGKSVSRLAQDEMSDGVYQSLPSNDATPSLSNYWRSDQSMTYGAPLDPFHGNNSLL